MCNAAHNDLGRCRFRVESKLGFELRFYVESQVVRVVGLVKVHHATQQGQQRGSRATGQEQRHPPMTCTRARRAEGLVRSHRLDLAVDGVVSIARHLPVDQGCSIFGMLV